MDLTLQQRILKVTNELSVTKNGKNTFSKYDYFKLEDIQKALNPLLDKYNVFMHYDLTKSGDTEVYRGVLSLVDALNPEIKIDYISDIEKAEVKGASGIQMSGATLTYGKRQAVMNAFNLSEEDDDPNNDANDSKNPKNVKKAKTVDVPAEDPVESILRVFKPFGVTREDFEKKFGKVMEKLTTEEFTEIRALYSELKKQTKTKAEIFE